MVLLKERPPVSCNYHRKLELGGLENATVCIMPEGDRAVFLSDIISDDSSVSIMSCLKKVEDEKNGVYYMAENLSGAYTLLFPKRH